MLLGIAALVADIALGSHCSSCRIDKEALNVGKSLNIPQEVFGRG